MCRVDADVCVCTRAFALHFIPSAFVRPCHVFHSLSSSRHPRTQFRPHEHGHDEQCDEGDDTTGPCLGGEVFVHFGIGIHASEQFGHHGDPTPPSCMPMRLSHVAHVACEDEMASQSRATSSTRSLRSGFDPTQTRTVEGRGSGRKGKETGSIGWKPEGISDGV